MRNIVTYLILAVLAVALGYSYLNSHTLVGDRKLPKADAFKNTEYVIDGQRVSLVNGFSEVEAAPGSASKIVTKYFGNEARGDINGDGNEDIAFLLTQSSGGSGTFFYVVAAIAHGDEFMGTQAYLLGDRIAPQNTSINAGNIIVVNYADRAPGESFDVKPSVGKTLRLRLESETLGLEPVLDSSQLHDIQVSSALAMKPWRWVDALREDGTRIVPKADKPFVITLDGHGAFTVKTDCNTLGGAYKAEGEALAFTNIISTKMFCQDSLDGTFAEFLQGVAGFNVTEDKQLILHLKYDSGSMTFK